MRFLRENPELHGAKLRFIQFLCIAKRVIVYSMPLFGMVLTVTTSRRFHGIGCIQVKPGRLRRMPNRSRMTVMPARIQV